MRIPKLKLLVGVGLVGFASMLPAEFFADVLRGTTDTNLGGFDLSGSAVQLGVIFIGAVGMGMIKDTFMRSRSKKERRRYQS